VASSHRTRRSTSNEQTKRYQDAAEAALDQLEWAIDYLRRIRKQKIAKALDANRAAIVSQSGLKRGWRWGDDDG
jgi:hypothetical protein